MNIKILPLKNHDWGQVDKNMLFYAQIHSLDLDTSANPGAVGIFWAVAQQTSLRDVSKHDDAFS